LLRIKIENYNKNTLRGHYALFVTIAVGLFLHYPWQNNISYVEIFIVYGTGLRLHIAWKLSLKIATKPLQMEAWLLLTAYRESV